MAAILTLTVAGATAFLLLDAGCYFWLRHNEATRFVRTK
jgi:hypothetical protein